MAAIFLGIVILVVLCIVLVIILLSPHKLKRHISLSVTA
jgi:hypothetical protein